MTNIHIEDLSAIKKKITFEVPEDQVVNMIDAEYRHLKKTVQIKGFRKGKVPLNIIRSYFRTKVEADTARKIIEETFQPGLNEKQLEPVSVISIDPETVEVGKPFKYTAEIEVPPPIEVKGYKGLELKKLVKEVSDEEVNSRLESVRERHGSLNPIPEPRGIEQGDHLVVDVKAEVNGEPVASLTVNDYHMVLGQDYYLPEFDGHLEGMIPDETRRVNLNLPDNFPRKNLAGKEAAFEVTLKEAKVRVLPDLDDDFAKDLGEFETLDEVRAQIRDDLQRMMDNESTKKMRNRIVDQLIEQNEFEVPEVMVEGQIDSMLSDSLQNLALQGIDTKRLPPPTKEQRDQMRPAAIRVVKGGLILKEIGKREGVEVSAEEIEEGIRERAQYLGISPDVLKDVEDEELMEKIRSSVLQEKIYKLIEEHAEITEDKQSSENNADGEESGKE